MHPLREYVQTLLREQNVLAMGMCFPFAYQKAEEWFDTHFTKGARGQRPRRHPDLNDKSKFKVVHGTITNVWDHPPRPIVHGWVEMGDTIFDDQTKHTKPAGVPRSVYYEMYQPAVYEEYSAEEAILSCIKKGGEGPWPAELYDTVKKRDSWLNEQATPVITFRSRGGYGQAIVEMLANGQRIGGINAMMILSFKADKSNQARLEQRAGERTNNWMVAQADVAVRYRNQGLGKKLYRELFKVLLQKSAGSPVIVGPEKSHMGSGTSDAALHVWESLSREYPSAGYLLLVSS